MKPDTLGVVGLGAIGGSVAWRAARAGVKHVVGYSPIPKDCVAAVKVGAVTEIAVAMERVIHLSDLVVFDLPPKATTATLEQLSTTIVDRSGYCTDLASVKGSVVEKAAALRLDRHFAGSHPLVQLQRTGFEQARPDLLSGSLIYVTPLPEGEVAAAEIADFWKRIIGAEPVVVDAVTHDATLAWTSHMPQVVVSALADALAKKGPKGVTYGQGTKTATFPALASADTWTEIIVENKEHVLPALDSFLAEVGRLVADIESEDAQRIRKWFESGCRWRERLEG